MTSLGLAGREAPSPDPILLAGSILVGTLLAYLLYGVYSTQLLRYASNYSGKGRPLQYSHFAVCVATIAESISVCFASEACWGIMVAGISDPSRRTTMSRVAPGTPVLNGIVTTLVQFFFAQKIYTLSANLVERVGAGLIALLSLLQLAASIATPIIFTRDGTHIIVSSKALEINITVQLISTLICDILITSGMVAVIARNSRTNSPSTTKRIIDGLSVHTVENGLVTSLCALLHLILFFAQRSGYSVHLVFQLVIGRVYAVVMIISLNRVPVKRGSRVISVIEIADMVTRTSMTRRYHTNQHRDHDEFDTRKTTDLGLTVHHLSSATTPRNEASANPRCSQGGGEVDLVLRRLPTAVVR